MPVSIEELPADALDLLEPLWLALLDHHGKVSIPELEMVGPASSWPRRRRWYEECLAKPGAFATVARDGGDPLGYALVSIEDKGVLDDTWKAGGPTVGHLQTLVVAPDSRGQGVGGALMHAVEDRLREDGVADLLVGVVAGNAEALRFYERRGLTPFLTQLYRRL